MKRIGYIPSSILERPVDGLNLQPGTLGDQCTGRVLLVFLRHFG